MYIKNKTWKNIREKGRDLTQSYDKSPYTHEKKNKKQRDNTKTPSKTSITQRLRTDLGRSVDVTTATPLVWLNRFMSAQLSHQPWNKKKRFFTFSLY